MGDGYVGTAQDAVRIRRLEKQREAERRKIQELKTKSASAKGQPGLLQFGSSTSEVPRSFNFSIFSSFRVPLFNMATILTFHEFQILETAFKKETVGLVTREQYVEKVCYRFRNFTFTCYILWRNWCFACSLFVNCRGLIFRAK